MSDRICLFSDLLRAMRDPSVTPYQAKLLCIYRSYETAEEGAYPGDELVAQHMGTSTKQVQRHRQPLLDSGMLWRKLGGGGRKARYRVVVDPVEASCVANEREERRRQTSGLEETSDVRSGVSENVRSATTEETSDVQSADTTRSTDRTSEGLPYREKGHVMHGTPSTRHESGYPSREGAEAPERTQAREDALAREAGFTDAEEMRTLTELRSRDDGRYVPGGTFDIKAVASVIPIGHAPSIAANKPTDEQVCTCTGSIHQKGQDPHCAFTEQETGT